MLNLNELAIRVHNFLADFDPAFGYDPGVPGQENKAQWLEAIKADLTAGGKWIIPTLSDLLIEVPEAESDADALLGDIFLLQSAA